MQGVGVARIRVPGGHVRREVAISETMIPALAKELLSVMPKFVLCSGRQVGDSIFLSTFDLFLHFLPKFVFFSKNLPQIFAHFRFFYYFCTLFRLRPFPTVARRSPDGHPTVARQSLDDETSVRRRSSESRASSSRD